MEDVYKHITSMKEIIADITAPTNNRSQLESIKQNFLKKSQLAVSAIMNTDAPEKFMKGHDEIYHALPTALLISQFHEASDAVKSEDFGMAKSLIAGIEAKFPLFDPEAMGSVAAEHLSDLKKNIFDLKQELPSPEAV